MRTSFALMAAAASAALAAVSPLTPVTTPAGSELTLTWGADTTGKWTDVQIDFMTGDNWHMVNLENVATGIDGTKVTSYKWKVPEVTINSNIYFFQFTLAGDVSTAVWTTRFTVSSSGGQTVAPPSSIQPDGQTIGWGIGGIVGGDAPSTQPSSSPSAFPSSSRSISAPASVTSSAASDSASTETDTVTDSDDEFESSSSASRRAAVTSSQNDSSSAVSRYAAAGVGLAFACLTGALMA